GLSRGPGGGARHSDALHPAQSRRRRALFGSRSAGARVMNGLLTLWRNPKARHLAPPPIALSILILIAVLAPVIAPHDPLALDIGGRLAPPSAAHWLGQDEFGRDVLSRLLYGAQVSLSVALATGAVAALIGISAGMIGGYFGGVAEVLTVR